METHNCDRNSSKVLDGEDEKCAGHVAEVRETERGAEEDIGTRRVVSASIVSTYPQLSLGFNMDGGGHLLSLKVMRVSVRVYPAIARRFFVILVPSSAPRWRAHGSHSIPTRPPSPPIPPPRYYLYRAATRSQGIPRPCVI